MVNKISAFKTVFNRAIKHQGSEQALKAQLPEGIKSAGALTAVGDDRYLSEITKSVFKAGFVSHVFVFPFLRCRPIRSRFSIYILHYLTLGSMPLFNYF